MQSVARRWSDLPAVVRWTLGLSALALGYGAIYAIVASTFGLDSDDDDLLIRMLLLALAVPVAIAGVFQQRRRLGGKGQLSLYREAYRTGTVPDGANTEKWRPVVRKQARFFREGRRVVLTLGCLFVAAILAVGIVVLAGDADRRSALPMIAILLAVTAVAAWGVDRLWLWRRRQFARLERALDGA